MAAKLLSFAKATITGNIGETVMDLHRYSLIHHVRLYRKVETAKLTEILGYFVRD